MKHLHTFESFLNESKDEVIFSIDDDKLDQLLHAKFSKEIDYEDVKGDSYYALPKKVFDRFIDLADSSGFDVDYDGSEKSVVYVYESSVSESKQFKDLAIDDTFLRFGENGQLWKKKNSKQAEFIKNVGKKTAPYDKKAGTLEVFPSTMDVTDEKI